MRLHSFRIQGFRKNIDTEILFSNATFLIGENNVGKSTVLKALEYLLSDSKKIPVNEFFSTFIEDTNEHIYLSNQIVLTAEFRNVPTEAENWRGFKGRLLEYDLTDCPEESGLMIVYRKTFEPGKDYVVELKENKKNLEVKFEKCETLNDYIDNGLDNDLIDKLFTGEDKNKKITKSSKIYKELVLLDELYSIDKTVENWVVNPGGIPGNILVRLPKFLLIPAQDKVDEITGQNGSLIKTLNSLFEDVRDASENFDHIQHYLSLLEKELNPKDGDTEFGKMMIELNEILGDVFPNTKLLAATNLTNANVIKPKFDVEMTSNTKTPIENQGTGVIRSTVFAMLRYRSRRENTRTRPLIIGFEEPEIYLHPNAAFQMRDTIYELATSSNNQIICTTHSPFMVDLSRDSSQVLNSLTEVKQDMENGGISLTVSKVKSQPFNISSAFKQLQQDEKTYLKMLVKMDDYMSKVFFARNVLIVEGDTEEVVFKETIARMPVGVKKEIQHNWQIVKARGKGTIISLVKYLKAMDIHPHVIHDADVGTAGAEKFNLPISEAVADEKKHIMLSNCIENILGYPIPSKDKPFKAYEFINVNWGSDWDNVSKDWSEIVEKVFSEEFKDHKSSIEEVIL
ncbi:AAA family ATPase [Sporosarcina sp. D27]|uniref:AAA family ATPase n=1 Tax=Sporosarcina sp. D27 TaxID=1382305 RepID=UPI0004716D20|nr:AAA family ATPase [Sporosarcina sp. D27]